MDNKPIYRTAEDLGIAQWEYDGLAALVGPLGRDELKLNMALWHTCDTVHCIGGWISHLAGQESNSDRTCNGLRRLYFPFGVSCWDRITAPQAARAIVNLLVTGDPQWDAVMAEA